MFDSYYEPLLQSMYTFRIKLFLYKKFAATNCLKDILYNLSISCFLVGYANLTCVTSN